MQIKRITPEQAKELLDSNAGHRCLLLLPPPARLRPPLPGLGTADELSALRTSCSNPAPRLDTSPTEPNRIALPLCKELNALGKARVRVLRRQLIHKLLNKSVENVPPSGTDPLTLHHEVELDFPLTQQDNLSNASLKLKL